jgi:WD40 repeat protein
MVASVVFSPDGRALPQGVDKTVKLWDPTNGKSFEPSMDMPRGPFSCFSPDGKMLASQSVDKTVKLWAVATGETIRTLEGIASDNLAVGFSPDGRTLASGTYDKKVRLWRLRREGCSD